jgi:glycosyltransferase involved in cell wall biosynthesis
MGPGLRLGHLATALAREGCELLVLAVHNGSSFSQAPATVLEGAQQIEGRTVRTIDTAESQLSSAAVASRIRAFAPDALVGVTTLGASLACRLRLDLPLWADMFGDCMAEAQAKAFVHGHDAALARFWTTLAPVLHHADRFSAVSEAQADALVGQLGLAGRLTAGNVGVSLVHVVPCAAEEPDGVASDVRDRLVQRDAFVVGWSGSFNTWCDVATLVAGLEIAMARDPRLVFLATGGVVEGHDVATYERFATLVDASPWRDRFKLMGWVEPGMAEACMRATDVGVVVEHDLYERRFGSENRVVHWMARAIPCVTTARSELGRRLVDGGLAYGVRPANPQALADTLARAAAEPEKLRAMGDACARYCKQNFNCTTTAGELVAWCRQPLRASDSGARRVVKLGSFAEPQAMAQMLEAYLDELHLREVAFRGLRWLWRRLGRRAGDAVVEGAGACDRRPETQVV